MLARRRAVHGCDAHPRARRACCRASTRSRSRAIDICENVDPTPASYTWTSVGEPETTITSGPAGSAAQLSATFTFNSDQPDATFLCSLDGSPSVACTSPYSRRAALNEDEHAFEVHAVNQFTLHRRRARSMDLIAGRSSEWEVAGRRRRPTTTILSVVAPRPDRPDRAEHLRFELARHRQRHRLVRARVRVLARRRPVGGLRRAVPLPPARGARRAATTCCWSARWTMFENVDPTPAEYDVHDRGRARDDDPHRPGAARPASTSATFTFAADPARGRDVRVLARPRRRSTARARTRYTLDRPVRRARARGAGEGPAGRRRPRAGGLRVGERRHDAAGRDDHTGPAVATHQHDRDLHLHGRRPGRERCSARSTARRSTFCESPVTYNEADLALATGTAGRRRTRSRSRPSSRTCSSRRRRRRGSGRSTTRRRPRRRSSPAPPAEISVEPAVALHLRQQRARRRRSSARSTRSALPAVQRVRRAARQHRRVQRPRGRRAHAARARGRPEPERRPDAGRRSPGRSSGPALTTITADVPAAAGDDDARRARRSRCAAEPGRRHVHVLARRRRVHAVHLADDLTDLRARRPHVRGAGDEQLPARRGAAGESSSGRSRCPTDVERARDDDHSRLRRPEHRRATATFTLLGRPRRRDLPVLARPGAVHAPCASPADATRASPTGEHTLPGAARVSPDRHPRPVAGRSHEWTVDLLPDTFDRLPARRRADAEHRSRSSASPRTSRGATFECSLDGVAVRLLPRARRVRRPAARRARALRPRRRHASATSTRRRPSTAGRIGPPPDTAIISGPGGGHREHDGDVRVHAPTCPGVTFECALDEAAENLFFRPCASTVTLHRPRSSASTSSLVRAVDAAGNVDPTPAEWSWEIGGIPPPVMIESGPGHRRPSAATRRFVFSAARPNADLPVLARRRRALAVPVAARPTTASRSARTRSRCRSREPSSRSRSRRSRPRSGRSSTRRRPTRTSSSARPPSPAASTRRPAATPPSCFAFSTNEPHAIFECAIDGEPFVELRVAGRVLGPGARRPPLPRPRRAVDLNDVPSTTTRRRRRWDFTVVEAPETSIDFGPEGEFNGRRATFLFSSTVAGSTFECALDLGPFFACPNPYTLTGLPDGEHMLEVRAMSQHGVVDTTPEEWTWTVDDQLPDTTILSGPPASTTSTAAAFAFSSTEPGRVRVLARRRPVRGLRARADRCPASRRHIADRARRSASTRCASARSTRAASSTRRRRARRGRSCCRPTRRSSSGPADTTTRDDARPFTFTASTAGVDLRVLARRRAFATCTSPVEYTDLAVGWHYVAVRAVDAHGLVDTRRRSTAGPSSAPAETDAARHDDHARAAGDDDRARARPSGFAASELGVTFECSLDGARVHACMTRQTYTRASRSASTPSRCARPTPPATSSSTPASYTWTIVDGRRRRRPRRSSRCAPPTRHQHERQRDLRRSTRPRPARPSSARSTCSAFEPCTSPKTYTGIAAGHHTSTSARSTRTATSTRRPRSTSGRSRTSRRRTRAPRDAGRPERQPAPRASSSPAPTTRW